MYSQTIIDRDRAEIEAAYPDRFPRGLLDIPPASIPGWRARLSDVFNDKGEQLRVLSPEELYFVRSEVSHSRIDFAYWAERYSTINIDASTIGPLFPLWASQRLILDEIGRIQKDRTESDYPDGIIVDILKARQLGACLDPATQVLTADLHWVPLDEIDVGQSVVAVEEMPRGGRGAGRRMLTTIVEARRDIYDEAYELVFDTGVRVIATANHRFLTRNRGGVDTRWRTVGKMVVGEHIRFVTKPWGASDYEDGGLGGMLDGEGSGRAKPAGGAEWCISQVYGPVYDRLTEYFEARGYASFHEEQPDKRIAETSSKFGSRPVGKVSVARMDELFRLLGQTRPTRFIDAHWWDGKELPGKRNGFGWAEIVEIKPLGRRRMIDLQTGAKTFIAEGLVSHNSTLCSSILCHRTTTHPHTFGLLASDVPDNSAFLYDMYERQLDHLPWWMLPGIDERVKNDEIVFSTGSRLFVGASKSTRGADKLRRDSVDGRKGQLGRGRTIAVAHLSEMATWTNPTQVDFSFMPTVPYSPVVFVAKESTAQGWGPRNWWYTDWQLAKGGKGRTRAIFIPWYAEPSKYRLPAPLSWSPDDDTLAHARRAETLGPRWLHKAVSLTRDQLFWYQNAREEADAKDLLGEFLQEFPADDEEAFQMSGRSIFTVKVIERIKAQARPICGMVDIRPNRQLGI